MDLSILNHPVFSLLARFGHYELLDEYAWKIKQFKNLTLASLLVLDYDACMYTLCILFNFVL